MEGGGPAAKKARRLPEVLAHSPQSLGSLFKSKPPILQQQQVQQQPFQFQPQQERKRSMLSPPPVSPQASQIHHFYQQQQQMHRIQPMQHLQQQQQQPQQRRLQGHHMGKDLVACNTSELSPSEREPSSTANPPWANMLPVSLTMPLHAVSSGYAAIASAAANVGGPVRRMGAKRVPGPDEWRLNSGPGGPVSFISSPAALASATSPPSFMVSPATYAGPVNVSVANTYTFPHRMSSPTPSSSSQCSPNNIARASPPVHIILDPARAAAIERRKVKLKQAVACQQAELQACCQRLLVLQREWREELCSDIREEAFSKQTPEGYSVAV